MGLYFTPRMAMGISPGIISALKIKADKIALAGVARCMIFKICICGSTMVNMAGIMAKYLAMSLATLKVVREPLVIRSCFPISTTSKILVGSESRSTMLAASLAA